MVLPALEHSITKRAALAGLVEFRATNPRDFATDKHRSVDDEPYGGGPGMVMMAPLVLAALEKIGAQPGHCAPNSRTRVVLTDPAGRLFTQNDAQEFSRLDRIVFVCGHYEGLDERVRTCLCTDALSVGDFVLTGGELPALCMTDAIVRLLPGAIGDPASHEDDSHSDGLLGHPLFTRPLEFMGESVPDVLLSGNHREIARWRRRKSLERTRQSRPDLFAGAKLTPQDVDLLG